MTTTPLPTDPAPAGEPVTPTDLIGVARDARARREQAEYDVVSVAISWATAHEVQGPVLRERSGIPGAPGEGTGEFPDTGSAEDLNSVPDTLLSALERVARAAEPTKTEPAEPPGDPVPPRGPTVLDPTEHEESQAHRRWRGLPELAWDCAAPLAAALGVSTRSGWVLLRQAVTLQHRLPRTYRWWRGGHLHTRVARMVADQITGQPDDVCAWVDAKLATRIRDHQGIGPVGRADPSQTHRGSEAEEGGLRQVGDLGTRLARSRPVDPN